MSWVWVGRESSGVRWQIGFSTTSIHGVAERSWGLISLLFSVQRQLLITQVVSPYHLLCDDKCHGFCLSFFCISMLLMIFGYLISSIFLGILHWNASTWFSLFFAMVHSSDLYKSLSFTFRVTILLDHTSWYLFMASMVRLFLYILISQSVSSIKLPRYQG